MLNVFIALKFIMLFLGFTLATASILLSGADLSKTKMVNYGHSLFSKADNYPFYLKKLADGLQKIAIPLLALITLYSLADMENIEFLKDVVKEYYKNIIFGWVILLILIFSYDEILKRVKANEVYYGIYLFSAQTRCAQFKEFVLGCTRLAIQVTLFITLPILLFVIPFSMTSWSPAAYMVYFGVLFSYAFLFGISVFVIEDRWIRKLIFHDLGYLMAVVAILTWEFGYDLLEYGMVHPMID